MTEQNKTDGLRADATGMEEMVTALRADKDALAASLSTANDVIASLHNDASNTAERHDRIIETLHSHKDALSASQEAVFGVAQRGSVEILKGLVDNVWSDKDAQFLVASLIDMLETLRGGDYSYDVEERVSKYFLRLVNSCDEDRDIREEIIKEWTESGFITPSVDVDELTSIQDKVYAAVSQICEAKTYIEYAEENADEAQEQLQALLGKLE